MIIANILLEMNNGFPVKCWQKELHQIAKIEFEICTPFCLKWQRFIIVWAKASKKEMREE